MVHTTTTYKRIFITWIKSMISNSCKLEPQDRMYISHSTHQSLIPQSQRLISHVMINSVPGRICYWKRGIDNLPATNYKLERPRFTKSSSNFSLFTEPKHQKLFWSKSLPKVGKLDSQVQLLSWMVELGHDNISTWCQQGTSLPLHPLLIMRVD